MRSTQTLGTILYVEDNEALRHTLASLLRSRGFDVREADSGADALNQLDVRPDLLILDVHLPDLDGFEVCRRIKADPTAALTMVLLVSGQYVGLADRVQGLEGGADAYLTKPVEPEELIAHINALLRIRRAEKALVESEERYRDLFDNANYRLHAPGTARQEDR